MKSLNITIKKITPADAKRFLDNNKINRKLNLNWVDYYYQQMLNGSWLQTGDTIKIAEDGTLLDGQHRLNAVIKYGKPVEMAFAENVAKAAFPVLDTGKTRSAGDVLTINQYKNATKLAAAVRLILLYKADKFGRNSSGDRMAVATNAKITEFVENTPEIVEIVSHARLIFQRFRFIPAPAIAMMYYILSKKNQTSCDIFFDKYANGIDLGETSPIRILRERLLKDITNKTKLTRTDKVALFFMAWNAHRQGKRVQNLVLAKNYKFPRPV